jgi:hypothetical protein
MTIGDTRHSKSISIRELLGPVVQFYNAFLKMLMHDIDLLVQKYVKKMKRIVYGE